MNKAEAIESLSHISMGPFERYILDRILFRSTKGYEDTADYGLSYTPALEKKILSRGPGEHVITITDDLLFFVNIDSKNKGGYGVVRLISPILVFKVHEMTDKQAIFQIVSAEDADAVEVCVGAGHTPRNFDDIEYHRFIEVMTPDYSKVTPRRIAALACRLRSFCRHSAKR